MACKASWEVEFCRGGYVRFTFLASLIVVALLGVLSPFASARRGGPWGEGGGGGADLPTSGSTTPPLCRAAVSKVTWKGVVYDVKVPQDVGGSQRGVSCATFIPASVGYDMSGSLTFECRMGAWALKVSSCAETATTTTTGGGDGGGDGAGP